MRQWMRLNLVMTLSTARCQRLMVWKMTTACTSEKRRKSWHILTCFCFAFLVCLLSHHTTHNDISQISDEVDGWGDNNTPDKRPLLMAEEIQTQLDSYLRYFDETVETTFRIGRWGKLKSNENWMRFVEMETRVVLSRGHGFFILHTWADA